MLRDRLLRWRGGLDMAFSKRSIGLNCGIHCHLVPMRITHLDRLILQVVVRYQSLLVCDRLLGILCLDEVLLDSPLQASAQVFFHFHHASLITDFKYLR